MSVSGKARLCALLSARVRAIQDIEEVANELHLNVREIEPLTTYHEAHVHIDIAPRVTVSVVAYSNDYMDGYIEDELDDNWIEVALIVGTPADHHVMEPERIPAYAAPGRVADMLAAWVGCFGVVIE